MGDLRSRCDIGFSVQLQDPRWTMLISQVVESGTVRLAESWVMLGQVLKVKVYKILQVFLGERVWFVVNFMGSTE